MRYAAALVLGLSLVSLGQVPDAAQKPHLVLDPGGHTARVRAVSFTPDGKQLVSVSEDKSVRIWDVDSGACLRVLYPPAGPGLEGLLYAGALAPDGKTLAVAGYGLKFPDIPVYLIDLESGAVKLALRGHTDTVMCLAFSPTGHLLASAGYDKTIRVWSTGTGECLYTMQGHKGTIYGVAFAPEGPRLATAAEDKTARVWDFTTQKEVLTFQHAGDPQTIAWSPNGLAIAVGCGDRSVHVWNLRGEHVGAFKDLDRTILGVCFTPDSARVLFSRGAPEPVPNCSLLDLETGKVTWDSRELNASFAAVAVNPKRPIAAAAAITGEIFLLDLKDGKKIARLGSASRAAFGVGWSKDGTSVAWGNTVKLINKAPVERSFNLLTHELQEDPGPNFTHARVDLGETSLVRGSNSQVKVSRGRDQDVLLNLPVPGDIVQSFTLLDEGRAVVGSNFSLVLFDTKSGAILRKFQGQSAPFNGIAASPDGRFFATAGGDHTVRIWRPDRDKPLLTLFVTGNDWIAWTGEGYFACSPGGESLMGWYINRGPDKMGVFCPSVQVRKQLYRPELLKLLVKTGDLQQALDEFNRLTGNVEAVSGLVTVLPPKVSIVAPATNPLATEEEVVEVRAEAIPVNQHPVVAMRVLLDGRPIPGKDGQTTFGAPQAGKAQAAWRVKLPPGEMEHEIVVLADSPVSQGASPPLMVRSKARGFKVGQAPKVGGLPALYLLSIGVSNYPGKYRLDYAARDAVAFEDVMRKHGKDLYTGVQTKVLADQNASRARILDGLKWLKEARDQDICIVFFAGHGERDPASGTFYLLPQDVDPKRLPATACSGEEFKQLLADLPARRVLVILDTCHAGAFAGGGVKKRSLPDDVMRDLASGDYGVVVMASSTAGEVSLESDKLGHGYFTYALVKGLGGEAANKQGFVYLTDLDTYVTHQVMTLTNGQQHPVINRPIRPIPLTLVKKAG
jgi:WD40 repeat protein